MTVPMLEIWGDTSLHPGCMPLTRHFGMKLDALCLKSCQWSGHNDCSAFQGSENQVSQTIAVTSGDNDMFMQALD